MVLENRARLKPICGQYVEVFHGFAQASSYGRHCGCLQFPCSTFIPKRITGMGK